MNNKKQQMKGNLILTLTSVIWGIAFVAQSVGMQYVGPFTYQCVRSFVATIVMIPVALIFGSKEKGTAEERKELVKGGIVCGIVFTIASNLQQYGIQFTTVGKAGFLTALYMIFVPVIEIFIGKRPGWNLWLSIVIATVGMYLLCINGEFRLQTGDIFIILCALAFSFHIISIDHFAKKVDPIKLSLLQYAICTVLTFIPMMLFEEPDMGSILACWLPILYGGVMSTGVGYTLQMVGQRYTDPAVASIIMCLESVFSLLSGIILLGQIPGIREMIGCLLMFSAIIITQIPVKEGKENVQQ